MKLLALCTVLLVSGCEESTTPAAHARSHARNPENNVEKMEREDGVIRWCDNEQLADVYSFAPLLGPTCEKTPSALAADLFQTGAMLGGFAGRVFLQLRGTLDAVTEFPFDHDAGVELVTRLRQRYDAEEDREKSEIRKSVGDLASHDCLVAAIALEILRTGAECGEGAVDAPELKSAYRKGYVKICSQFFAETDCVSRADEGFDRYARDYRATVARELRKIRQSH
jgi:hypothetical protein